MNTSNFVLLAVVVSQLLACNSKQSEQKTSLFEAGIARGMVDNRLHEASGIVESKNFAYHFWTLNDSGNPAEVFLLDSAANIKMICTLKGIDNRDFEDIALGKGPDSSKTYIYAADIGDNQARYPIKLIYRFAEPALLNKTEELITDFDTLQVALPDGVRDSETLLIDPINNDLYLISKLEDSVGLYRVAYPFAKGVMTADKVATLPFHKIVAGDISADGKEVLLKDYDYVYYWRNSNNLSLAQLLVNKPEILKYDRELQGEAIAWARDGSGYYTLSEKVNNSLGKLLFYKRK
jgi:hypothetical protein